MNIYEKIQSIRIDLKKKGIKMTGRNDYAGYDYFELDDFLIPLNELMQEYKITAIPSFTSELATLTVVNIEDPNEMVVVTSPFGSAALKGCHEVQNIGAVETYQRRYLYQALFDIAESDVLNKTQGKPTTTSPKQASADTNTTNSSKYPTKTQSGQEQANNAAKQEMSLDAAKTMVLTFGKYNGKKLQDVDDDYLKWLAENSTIPTVAECARLVLEDPDRLPF